MEPSDFYGIGGMDETACVDHIRDDVLHAALSNVADKFECSFCGRKPEPGEPAFAVELDELGVRVWDVLNWLYQSTEDGGDPWRCYEEYDNTYVMYETVEDAVDPEYAMHIVERLIAATSSTDAWIPSDSADPSALGWGTYSATVRTESRFVVVGASNRPGYEDEPPARIGKFLEALLAYVESDLLVELPADSTLYRGRMTDDARALLHKVRKEPSTELGSAPPQLAKNGRLSPPGISLFYSADDLHVAVAEIALHSEYDQAVMGAFKTTRSLRILDFTRPLTKLPSIFATDDESRRRWTFARFKKHFTDMITAPVVLDGREAVDYTPTQVVAEWLRWVPEDRIDGIAWPSHLAEEKGDVAADSGDALSGAHDAASVPLGRNVALFFGYGADFQSVPPTAVELARPIQRKPTLTLAADDITSHQVSRSVRVAELREDEADDDPYPMFMGF
ncbi:RES domain-containing protein [Leifsonia sp. PS1209]|uniref:RES domain-containing protein n=1 Tax=Leifsonia sp. PS1209 TaxID=2724914 RepID=UPI001442B152|nr:RES domain-containing protein [Leifsonia sp. PS1209]QIZ99429.1 RES family NAD+ phosphorylase [Leifsonia sp. PS1209]